MNPILAGYDCCLATIFDSQLIENITDVVLYCIL